MLALAVSDGLVCVHWVSIRGGRHVGDKSFFPDTKNDPEPNGQDYAEAFVAQHYLGKSKPDIIISNFPVPDALKEALEGEHGKQMQFVTKTIGERKVWLKMAEQNAQMAIAQRRLQQSSQQHRIDELAKILGMDSDGLNRLECFDISHTQGEATIASCVVYDEQNIQPSQYRRYNITTAKPGDDYAAMREVLTRRYGKMQEAEANGESVKWPDVVLIDGGKGQIGIAVSVWEELGLHIPLVGIAKAQSWYGRTHTAFTGEVFACRPIVRPCIYCKPYVTNHTALRLQATVKTRQSTRYFLTQRNPGIGGKRRQALLTRFGGLRGVIAASRGTWKSGRHQQALAETIYEHLH